jgi:hypothetical protein
MTETGGGKEVRFNEMDLLILDIFGKDNPSIEGLDGGDCFQAEEAVVDLQHLYCQLICPNHPLSEMKRGIHTLGLDTQCI